MKERVVLRWIIVFVIIVGGVLIIVSPKLEAGGVVCGGHFSTIAGIVNIVLGLAGLAMLHRLQDEE